MEGSGGGGQAQTPPVSGAGAVVPTVSAVPVEPTSLPQDLDDTLQLDTSPEGLAGLPPMDADAPSATPLDEAAGAASSAEQGGSPEALQPHPGVAYLAENPDVIKRILEQVSQSDCSYINDMGVFDEQGDGTLAADGALSSMSPGGAARLKAISIIRTPAEGLKHKGVSSPRPNCQWFAPSVAIVDFTVRDDSRPAERHAPTRATYRMDTEKRIATWNGQGAKAVAGVEGLSVRYFTPTGTDQTYIEQQNMTLYHLNGTDFYLMLVHNKRGNNAGKKRARVEVAVDHHKNARDIRAKIAKSRASEDLTPALRDRLDKMEEELNQFMTELKREPPEMSTQARSTAASSEPTMRGGDDSVHYPTKPEPTTVARWEHHMDEMLNELQQIDEELSAVNILVVTQVEEVLAAAEEVDIIASVFGNEHVEVVTATSRALGQALMGEQAFDIVHFIGHGDVGTQFCLRTDVSDKHFHMDALCDLLRTHNNEKGGKLRLVFFNACHSEEQGKLLSRIDVDDGGIASVVCVPGRIADTQIAVPFSRDFYTELASQLSLDTMPERAEGLWGLCIDWAYQHARQCILMDPVRQKVMSAHPMLLPQPDRDDPWIVSADWAAQPEKLSADRGYQSRLIASAEQMNSIIVLRTGAGKTRIALRMAEIALRRFPSKRVVFTAPTTPLVEQQMKFFSAELRHEATSSSDATIYSTIRVGGHFGGKNRGEPDANLLFFTPAKLAEFLTRTMDSAGHGLGQSSQQNICMENISLLIVDECHHTRGASPLTTVAELYRTSKIKPRFLGLTALPVKHDDDSTATSSEPIGFGTMRQDTSLEGLCACWMAHLDTVEPGSPEDKELLEDVPVPDIIPRALDAPTAQLLKSNLQGLKEKGLNPNSDDYEAAEIVAKLPLVAEELRQNLDGEFRAIVFVHNRTNAHFLLEQLSICPDLSGYGIQADCVTGHSKSGGMSQAHQKHVLDRFRSGSLNLIVATSVAEEGIDIPECNLVVRMDAAVTDIGFVQSRGRARYPKAKYVVVCTTRSEVEALIDGERKVLAKVWELCSHHRKLPSPCQTIWEKMQHAAPDDSDAAAVAVAAHKSLESAGVDPSTDLAHAPQPLLPPSPQLQQKDPTMELNEHCHQAGVVAGPEYREEQLFQYTVSVAGGAIATGKAVTNKKEAKKDAAAQWLVQNIRLLPPVAVDNPIGKLNELCQKTCRSPPQYKGTQLGEQLFQYSVIVESTDEVLGQRASNKKDAKRNAANAWLGQHC